MPPGKLAPKLFQDLLTFDPIHGKPNILTESPKPVGDGPQIAPLPDSCKHDYTVKHEQSVSPPLELRPDERTQFKIAVICKRCRIHASVFIDYTSSAFACPGSDHPLHHFVRVTPDHITSDRIRYGWQCSIASCGAKIFISYRTPRLSLDDLALLGDEKLLKRRYDVFFEQDPTREGIRAATPMDSLFRLRRYVRDALNPEQARRSFPANNKRFQEAFGMNGRDCADLLQRLGFKYASPDWILPDPFPIDVDHRLGEEDNGLRELCEDVTYELLALMFQLASDQSREPRLVNPAATEGWPSANRDLERILGAQGYQRHSSLRRIQVTNEELPYFFGLGALPDFSDTLIEYAFERQSMVDPQQQPYYFECLQVITDGRNTEQLQMKVATMQSTGAYSRRELRSAYSFLNIQRWEEDDLSDQRIIELFHARQSDLSPSAQEEARGALYKIGIARESQMLQKAAQQSVETYEDALTWLGHGVDRSTSDESLLAVVATKTAESSSNEEIAQKAIATIAKARRSNLLNNWLLTGRTDGVAMSVDEALRHLAIEQPFDTIEQTILPALFDSARQDRPGEMTEKAIATIEQALQGGTGGVPPSPDSWPVGLTSHGNTCYLNSLLQYYFSIRALRDIILTYDQYKLDTAICSEKTERVGQRKISMVEIKGGQRFAEDLKALFVRMITSPHSSVRPEEDLVCRAFLEPKDYALLASSVRDEMGEVSTDQFLVNGLMDSSEDKMINASVTQSPTAEERNPSDSSSTTLQTSNAGDDADIVMKNSDMPPTPPTSPGLGPEAKSVPEHAPPLPPRRFSTTKEEALQKAQENARQQQDVTEVHDGIMFRLRSGMMPRSKDSDDEQEDALRDIFSMGIIETTVNRGVIQQPKRLSDSSIQLNVPYVATDIYSALDAVFDLQPYEENPALETFKTISDLPPLLQVNIPRIGFDKDRVGNQVYKVLECVRLTNDLYLDRYCEAYQTQLLPKRQQCQKWRKELRQLQRRKKVLSDSPTDLDLDGPSALGEGAFYITGLDAVNRDLQDAGIEPIEADADITAALTNEAQEQSARLSTLDGQIYELQRKIDKQFEAHREVKYQLAAVFFHRGAAGHGHYWIYIHDFQNNMWRSYNDEHVQEFTKLDEIFEANIYNQGTPTYAVYVASDKTDLIQAVCRDPEKPPPSEMAPPPPLETDVSMTGQMGGDDEQVIVGIDPQLLQNDKGQHSSWDDSRQDTTSERW